MGDFYQNGVITTFQNLARRPVEEIERELLEFRRERPMALVLPCLFSELEGPALENILNELAAVPYLEEIVIGLDRADEAQFRYATEFFSRLPQRHHVLWNDGPRLRALDDLLKKNDLAPTELGKGRNVWYCFGYVLALNSAQAVALHDCDILTYSRDLLARLLYPLANPNFTYQFCKGYYTRAAGGRLHGRVCRLLVTPLVRSLLQILGQDDFLQYLDSFRYALAGEFSLRTEVIRNIRVPSDWGLEIGVLSEMDRNYSRQRICQADIADAYDHKHQKLSPEDASQGLSKMSTDIAKAIFRKLATNGHVFTHETFRTVKATYYRAALDVVEMYDNVASFNGFAFERHAEEQAVELFAQNIMRAGWTFLESPMDTPFIPNWSRVISAVPDVLERLREAVDQDSGKRRLASAQR